MGEFDIRAPRGAVKKKKMLGRGTGTGYGSTAGRGTKGQKSRSGGGVRPGFEGGQMPLFRRVARRGFSNYPFKKSYDIVSLDKLEKYKAGETVNIDTLIDRGIIKSKKRAVKILANGTLTKKLTVENLKVSKKARDVIESLGGEVKNQDEEVRKQTKNIDKEKKAVKPPVKTPVKAAKEKEPAKLTERLEKPKVEKTTVKSPVKKVEKKTVKPPVKKVEKTTVKPKKKKKAEEPSAISGKKNDKASPPEKKAEKKLKKNVKDKEEKKAKTEKKEKKIVEKLENKDKKEEKHEKVDSDGK